MNDKRWPQSFKLNRDPESIDAVRLVAEFEEKLGSWEDELGNVQAPARLDFDEDGALVVSFAEDVKPADVRKAISEHDPAPPPKEPKGPTPVEELNAGIQAATSLGDVKAVFESWTEKHRERL